jgi:hypothetical protein
MTMAPIMWSVWGILLLILAALHLYRARLTRDEEDQIFLGEGFEHEKAMQSAIVDRVNKIQPAFTVAIWLVGAATVWVIGYYAVDTFNQFK